MNADKKRWTIELWGKTWDIERSNWAYYINGTTIDNFIRDCEKVWDTKTILSAAGLWFEIMKWDFSRLNFDHQ